MSIKYISFSEYYILVQVFVCTTHLVIFILPLRILKCKIPNEIELKDEFVKIRNEQGLKSFTSIES